MNTNETEYLPTRAGLLERIKDWEDRESWRDFYDTYWRLILGVALKSGLSQPEAEEALQETVIAVAREIKKFQYDPARGSFNNWLLTQTRWRIADRYRKRRRQMRLQNEETSKTGLMENVPDPQGQERPVGS